MHRIDKLAWILISDRTVLYVRSRGAALFYNPGGKRDGEETDLQALSREIKEELSVELVPETMEYVGTFAAQAAGKPAGVVVESTCYHAAYRGTLTPASEIEELAWLSSADRERTSAVGQLILEHLRAQDLID